jgi:branched-chain amino acid transport system substrate-binding protein
MGTLSIASGRRRRLSGLLALLSIPLSSLLIGCGSGGGAGAPSPGVTTPVKIGVSISSTGALSKTAKTTLAGYQLWAKQVNAGGGLLGRKVELIVLDDQSDPATGTKLYEKLITQDKVDLVFGPFSSGITSAVAPVTERYQYPVVAGGASSSKIWQHGYKYIFQVAPPDSVNAAVFINLANSVGVKTIAVINEATAFPQTLAAAAIAQAPGLGMKVVLHEEFQPQVNDFTGLLLKIKQLNPDMILAGTYYDEAVLLTRQIGQLGLKTPWIAETIGPDTKDFVTALGQDSNLLLGTTDYTPLLSKDAANFEKAYIAEYGVGPTYQAALAYSAGEVLAAAVKRTGTFDREKLRDALATLKVPTISGKYQVDSTGAQVGAQAYVLQIQGGKQVLVWPKENATAIAKPRS